MAFQLQRVLISDEVDDKCIRILSDNGIEAVKKTKLKPAELLEEIKEYDGLIVRSATQVTSDVIKAGSRLRIIGRAGTGVDNIDCVAATKHGVIVMNTPGGNTLSAAEHTCTLLLSMSRQVSNGTESLRAGRWDRKKFMGNEVYGKTLAIIGLGRIGKEVATRMQSFGMTTIGFDPIIPAEVSAEFNTQWMTLDEIWPKADYITVHTPLIPQTKYMLNDEVFSKCKKGVKVINVARGGIIEEAALLRALNEGQCGGAALDVFEGEPSVNPELVKHPMVTSTPHLGASTTEAQTKVAEDIAQQFVDLRDGTNLFGAINAQALTNALSVETKPWVRLGEGLGSIGAALLGRVGKQTEVKVITEGDVLANSGSYLGAATLVGLLRTQSTNGLNLVSAPAYAKEIGIQLRTEHVKKTQDGAQPLVTVVVQEQGGAVYTLSGQVAAGRAILTCLTGMKFDNGVALNGNLLIFKTPSSVQALATAAGVLTNSNITLQAFTRSMPQKEEAWNVIRVTPAPENITDLQTAIGSNIFKVTL